MWQILSIVFVRFIYIYGFVHYGWEFEVFQDIDTIAVPLLIEICYLGCNRRVMGSICSFLKAGNYCKVCCCPCIDTNNRVEPPAQQPVDLEMVVTTGPLPSLPPRRPAAA
ncbi:unnamed protein product [Caenorhabditis nigoni]